MCEVCTSREILFPFQVETTRQCSACRSYFHSECFRKMQASKQTCPKCARIAAFRDRKDKAQQKRREEAESTVDTQAED
jgi:hydrogenase maturation factor HypF (carbamoyltransferase family)